MSKAVKIHKRVVTPVVVRRSVTWPVTGMDMKRINTWQGKILSSIYGLVVEQGTWRIRANQELWKLPKDIEVVGDFKKKRSD
jgi:hypothetical protein